ncbi:unnamed protein product [Peniophora sp. CBMAI 1063]|nr:unnamed protein product [Peniophora sp. CBMAI 1063]
MPPDPRADGASRLDGIDERWIQALDNYKQETGRDLLQYSFATDLLSQSDTEKVMERLKDQAKLFTTFRSSGRKVLDTVKPIVAVVLRFIDAGAEGASSVAPGGKAIFVAFAALLQAMKETTQLYDTVESLLQQVKAYVERVGIHLQPATPPSPALMRILLDTLVQVLNVLAILTKYCNAEFEHKSKFEKTKDVLSRRTKDWLRVIADKADVKDALAKLRDLASAELQVTAAHTNAVVRNVEPKVAAVYDRAVIKDLRRWLRPPNTPEPNNYESKRQAGSCEWFFDDDFEGWKACKNGLYWVYGNAGSGKSVLSSSIVEKLMGDAVSNVIYFYFDYTDPEKRDCRALVSSLVLELGTRFDVCLQYLNGFGPSSAPSPTYEKLLEMFSHLLSLSGRTFLVIDALDECPESSRDKGLGKLLSTIRNQGNDLRTLVTSRPKPDIRKCLAPSVTYTLGFHECAKHVQDLSHYINTRLSDEVFSRWPEGIKRTAQDTLIKDSRGMFLWVDLQLQYLKHCAPNDVLNALRQLPSGLHQTYERILNDFASHRAMINRARYVLQCIAFSTRPLTPSEVFDIFSVDFDHPGTAMSKDITHFGPGNRVSPKEVILERCPGLLTFTRAGNNEIVQFIHFSVQEYLVSSVLRSASYPARLYYFDEDSAHLTLATFCLSLINHLRNIDRNLDSVVRFERYQRAYEMHLPTYAFSDWSAHVSPRNECALEELLHHFLRPSSPVFNLWRNLKRAIGLGHIEPHQTDAFRCAVALGLCNLVDRILQEDRITSRSPSEPLHQAYYHISGRFVLHEAADHGQADMCRLLLQYGADVFSSTVKPWNEMAIHIAARRGHVAVADTLLEHGISDDSHSPALIGARNGSGQTALHLAIMGGHMDLFDLLLKRGACVQDTDGEGSTPIHLAASRGYTQIVQKLLDRYAQDGLDFSAWCQVRNHAGRTPLHDAARYRHYQAVHGLLSTCNIAIDVRDNHGRTPLHYAVTGEYDTSEVSEDIKTTRVILEFSARNRPRNVSQPHAQHDSHKSFLVSRDDDGCTPLHMAACGREEVVCLLLKHIVAHSVDPTLVFGEDARGDTPLHSAAKGKDSRLLGLLLEHIVVHMAQDLTVVQRRNVWGDTPLHTAAREGRKFALGRLLEHVVHTQNPTVAQWQNAQGYTSLHYAAELGNTDMINLLKKHFTTHSFDPALALWRDVKGCTPFHHAASQIKEDALRCLLDWEGFPNDVTHECNRTLLHKAAFKGWTDMIRILLEHPAAYGTNARARCHVLDKDGRTALYHAVEQGQADSVRYLIDRGSPLGDTNTPAPILYYLAAMQGRRDIVSMLLEHPEKATLASPAQYDTPIQDGDAALQKAMTQGQTEIARCLLYHGFIPPSELRTCMRTFMRLSISSGNLTAVRTLLEDYGAQGMELGAQYHPCGRDRDTELHEAVRAGNIRITRVLLGHGAPLRPRDRDNRTPLELAVHHKKFDVICVFLERTAEDGYDPIPALLTQAEDPEWSRKIPFFLSLRARYVRQVAAPGT